ncbi:MAG: chloride channel protein, partial [Mesorhizobium sp.]
MPARNEPQVYARRLRAVLINSIPVLEARGIVIVLMAGMVGMIAGALVTGMSGFVQGMHFLLF